MSIPVKETVWPRREKCLWQRADQYPVPQPTSRIFFGGGFGAAQRGEHRGLPNTETSSMDRRTCLCISESVNGSG